MDGVHHGAEHLDWLAAQPIDGTRSSFKTSASSSGRSGVPSARSAEAP
jgi:hypothetical protein